MNYYNPYYFNIPTEPKIGLLGKLFGKTGITISNFLNGTQRVLNIANQTIPLVKQVRPIIGNAKTMFKVMNEFKRTQVPVVNNSKPQTQEKEITTNSTEINNGPIFFV